MKLLRALALANCAVAGGISSFRNVYLDAAIGSACVAVVASDDDAYIRLMPDSEAPVLVLTADAVIAAGLPVLGDYDNNIKVEDGRFDVEGALFNGVVSEDLKVAINETAIYCVYAQYAADSPGAVVVAAHSSHGFLDYTSYSAYRASKATWVVGVLVTGLLFAKLVSSAGSDFSRLGSLSVVSKGAVFFVLLPTVVSGTFLNLVCFVLNRSAYVGWFATLFLISANFLSASASAVSFVALLMFCMGEGVIYYHLPTVSFRQTPARKLAIAKGLFVALLVSGALVSVGNAVGRPGFYTPTPQVANSLIAQTSLVAMSLTAFVGGVLCLYYVFQTKKAIRTNPPFGSEFADADERNASVASAFNRSVVVIFVAPLVVGVVLAAVAVSKFMKSSGDLTAIDKFSTMLLVQEQFQLANRGIMDLTFWVNLLTNLVIISAVYFIWVRRNHGLVVDQKEVETSEVGLSRYDVASDDEVVL